VGQGVEAVGVVGQGIVNGDFGGKLAAVTAADGRYGAARWPGDRKGAGQEGGTVDGLVKPEVEAVVGPLAVKGEGLGAGPVGRGVVANGGKARPGKE